jgi:hypothetical protein
MTILDKIDRLLIGEGAMADLDIRLKSVSQQKLRAVISKGLTNAPYGDIALSLWHYVNPAIIMGSGGIYKTQSSMKIMDELWFRVGRNLEKSETLTDEALVKLKKNFYSLSKSFEKIYNWNPKEKRWEIY